MHVLLVVNSYFTNKDARRGAKFQTQLRAYKHYTKESLVVGLVAVLQRDIPLRQCLASCRTVFESEEFGAPIVQDARYFSLFRQLPVLGGRLRTLGASIRAVEHYIAAHGRPDILHAHGSQWAGFVAEIVKRKYNIPYVVTEHMSNHAFRDTRYHAELQRVFKHADGIFPISSQVHEALEKRFGPLASPVKVIPNMINEAFLKRALPVRQGKASTHIRCLAIGALREIKNHTLMITAFRRVVDKDPNCHLTIVGDGDGKLQLGQLISKLKLVSNVTLLGQRSQEYIAQEMSRSDLLLCSSQYETFGIPLIEAMASGLPVVSTNVGIARDIVTHENGLLVDDHDARTFSNAIQECMRNIRDGFYNASSIRAKCAARFSPDFVVSESLCEYKKILNR